MKERLCVVQFLHPGGEPRVPAAGEVAWNTQGRHTRKFLRAAGRSIDAVDGSPRQEKLGFWGEWEAQSLATPASGRGPGEPAWIHEPFFDPPAPGVWAQNTDPFVFGAAFHFTGCQQHSHVGNPTQLARLRPGSLILFGSGLGRRFVLDTVFVVGPRWIEHSRKTRGALDGEISDEYREITIDRWYAGRLPDDRVHGLYFGATFDDPFHGMFSFFPCTEVDGSTRGFARPEIRLPGVVTPTQTQKYRRTPVASPRDATESWRSVVDQVLAAGLRLGIRADMPRRVAAATPVPGAEPSGCAPGSLSPPDHSSVPSC